ncbi:MAG TPA: twin-arginine translocase TatA/TatE family subunit [bacterium]|nr:twin-arginine translocase TatA/TatE family subunit [bacterium]
MFGFSYYGIIIIFVIIFLIFGAGKLPEIGSGIGKALKNFKNSVSGNDEIDVTPKEEEKPKIKKKQISRTSSTSSPQKRKRQTRSGTAKTTKKA